MYRVYEFVARRISALARFCRVAVYSCLTLSGTVAIVQAQTAAAPVSVSEITNAASSAPVPVSAPTGSVTNTGKAHASASVSSLPWTGLSAAQRDALAPLSDTWNAFSDTRKRKWISIANSLPNLSAEERLKLRERMEDWAKLSRRDREQARLNFAQSKTISKADLAANWEAYQALSTEERQRLASLAPQKPPGAAVALKPAPVERMVAVPLTRQSPQAERSALAQQMQLDRNTLLPRLTPARSASSPARP